MTYCDTCKVTKNDAGIILCMWSGVLICRIVIDYFLDERVVQQLNYSHFSKENF